MDPLCKATTYELDFEGRLHALEVDAETCAQVSYTDFTFSHYVDDPDSRDRLNVHSGFWLNVRHSLQLSTFIILARMFDRTAGTHTILDLLKYAEKHHGIFERDALINRKRRGGMTLEQATEYASDRGLAGRDVWKRIRDEANQMQAAFDEKVGPIRHQVFAHHPRAREDRDKLFNGLPIRKLEELCVYPLRLSRAVGRFYRDGVEPSLDSAPTIRSEVLRDLPDRWTSTWEHRHAAKDASEFFEWLKTVPLAHED